jgi:hypothetical protein
MTGRVILLADKRCSSTEEGVDTSGDNNTFSLTLLTGRTTVKLM